MDWFLVGVIVVSFVILLVVNVYLIVHFQHPDDKNEAYLPKILILIGFTLAEGCILLLPLDVANKAGYAGCAGYDNTFCGGLDMALAWEIVYIMVLVYVVFLIPFCIFYYEADDGMNNVKESQLCSAIKYEVVVLIVSVLSLVLMYNYLGSTFIPVVTMTATFDDHTTHTMAAGAWTVLTAPPPFADTTIADDNNAKDSYPGVNSDLEMMVTFPVYVMAMLGFVGWFFFTFFAGVGLAALPIDLICSYIYRPRHMDAIEFAEAQLSVRVRVNELIEIGEMIKRERHDRLAEKQGYFQKRAGDNADRVNVNRFKQAVLTLESDAEELKLCHVNFHKFNGLIPIAQLLAGLVSMMLSMFWILQIVLFVLPPEPLTPFLNGYFEWFDTWFPLFGVLSVAIFCMYLQMCVVKGCFKFGCRFFLITLHPMKVNGTYMSSFLFNLGLILLCSIPVVQFSVIAFADYARFSDVNQIFGVQIKYLKFFSYFWTTNAFIYAILAMCVLSTFYLMVKPRDNPASALELKDHLRKSARTGRR